MLQDGNGNNDITRREFIALTKVADDTNEKVTATDLTVMRIETQFKDFLAQHCACQKSTKDKFRNIYIAITTLAGSIVAASSAILIFGKG
jgi:hypothetical protein